MDALQRPVLASPESIRVLESDGAFSWELEVSDGVSLGTVAPMADGSLAVAVSLDSLEVSGSIPVADVLLSTDTPSGIARYDSDGSFLSFVPFFETSGAKSPVAPLYLGCDDDDRLWAGVYAQHIVWDADAIDLPGDGLTAVGIDTEGSVKVSSQLSTYGDHTTITGAMQGVVVSAGAQQSISIDGTETPVGEVGGLGSIGVAVNLGPSAAATSVTVLGDGPHYAVDARDGTVVASKAQAAPFRVATCQVGTAECDSYDLAGTESSGNRVVVTSNGAVYLAGNLRLMPTEEGLSPKLYVMRIDR